MLLPLFELYLFVWLLFYPCSWILPVRLTVLDSICCFKMLFWGTRCLIDHFWSCFWADFAEALQVHCWGILGGHQHHLNKKIPIDQVDQFGRRSQCVASILGGSSVSYLHGQEGSFFWVQIRWILLKQSMLKWGTGSSAYGIPSGSEKLPRKHPI